MRRVVSVVFRKGGKAYYFDPDGLDLKSGDTVIVRTSRGTEFAEVAAPAQEMPEELIPGQVKKVVRKANDDDRARAAENKAKEEDAFKAAQERIGHHKLNMKLVDVEVTFDGSKILFYFTSEERIDFRDLVRELASAFKTRIEMRQIGARDEAKMVGGLGPCGRRLCCTVFAGEFEPVSIRMAKEQKLPLNPMKISGICGRLMCCLRYEYETYKDFRGRVPKKGTVVSTSLGDGKIVDFNVPRESVTVELEGGLRRQVPLCEVCVGSGAGRGARRPEDEGGGRKGDSQATPSAEAKESRGAPSEGEEQTSRAGGGRRSGRRRRSGARKKPGSGGDAATSQTS